MPYDGPNIDWTSGSSLISPEEMTEYVQMLEDLGLPEEEIAEKVAHLASILWFFIGLHFGVDPFSLALAERDVDKSLKSKTDAAFKAPDMVDYAHAEHEKGKRDA